MWWRTHFVYLHSHARGHPEGGGNGGKYSDNDVENLSPNWILFHGFLIYDLWIMIYDLWFMSGCSHKGVGTLRAAFDFFHHRVHWVPRSFFIWRMFFFPSWEGVGGVLEYISRSISSIYQHGTFIIPSWMIITHPLPPSREGKCMFSRSFVAHAPLDDKKS